MLGIVNCVDPKILESHSTAPFNADPVAARWRKGLLGAAGSGAEAINIWVAWRGAAQMVFVHEIFFVCRLLVSRILCKISSQIHF